MPTDGHVIRSSKSTARLIVVENGVEARPIAIEEVFVAEWIEEQHASRRIAEQRSREVVQRLQLRLELQARDVDHHALGGLEIGMLGRFDLLFESELFVQRTREGPRRARDEVSFAVDGREIITDSTCLLTA